MQTYVIKKFVHGNFNRVMISGISRAEALWHLEDARKQAEENHLKWSYSGTFTGSGDTVSIFVSSMEYRAEPELVSPVSGAANVVPFLPQPAIIALPAEGGAA